MYDGLWDCDYASAKWNAVCCLVYKGICRLLIIGWSTGQRAKSGEICVYDTDNTRGSSSPAGSV